MAGNAQVATQEPARRQSNWAVASTTRKEQPCPRLITHCLASAALTGSSSPLPRNRTIITGQCNRGNGNRGDNGGVAAGRQGGQGGQGAPGRTKGAARIAIAAHRREPAAADPGCQTQVQISGGGSQWSAAGRGQGVRGRGPGPGQRWPANQGNGGVRGGGTPSGGRGNWNGQGNRNAATTTVNGAATVRRELEHDWRSDRAMTGNRCAPRSQPVPHATLSRAAWLWLSPILARLPAQFVFSSAGTVRRGPLGLPRPMGRIAGCAISTTRCW